MKSILLVTLGGAAGSAARCKLSGWVLQRAVDWRFPLGTFVVNAVGCLVIWILAGLAIKDNFFSAATRIFLFTGIVGGFTTFSAFELETFYLLRRGEILVAGNNVMLSVLVGLLTLWPGFSLVTHKR